MVTRTHRALGAVLLAVLIGWLGWLNVSAYIARVQAERPVACGSEPVQEPAPVDWFYEADLAIDDQPRHSVVNYFQPWETFAQQVKSKVETAMLFDVRMDAEHCFNLNPWPPPCNVAERCLLFRFRYPGCTIEVGLQGETKVSGCGSPGPRWP